MFSAQALDFLCHHGKVFERTYRLVGIPVGNEKRTRPHWQHTRESNRVPEFKAAAKNLEHSLDHRICLIGRCQTC